MSTPGTSTRQQWLVLAAAFLGWMFDGLEQGLFPIAARPALIDLMHVTDDAVIGPVISNLVATFLAGAALGGLFVRMDGRSVRPRADDGRDHPGLLALHRVLLLRADFLGPGFSR